jgi:alginate O-acetyltransferase complex protein AlgI
MLFNTLPFLYLVIFTVTLYYFPPLKKIQLPILIASSFVFYAWNFPILLLLLLFSIGINAFTSFHVEQKSNFQKRRFIATSGVVINLLLLSTFKYAGLLGNSIAPDSDFKEMLLAIPLPVGISFFTFQGISLVVDTFREKKQETFKLKTSFGTHLKKTALYIALFPQLIAGPIVKAHDFFPQIKIKYFKDIDWQFVFKHLVTGYFLKMFVADNLKDFTFWLTYPYFENLSTPYNLTLLFAYSMQIFADFAGYSLIAIGLSKLFGYNIPQNFNFPYISKSFSEFWRRWHISLSTFLQQYLYIPLGGNRKGKTRTYFNLMIVMALGGLWHGAAWSYMVWGIAHGVFLALERLINNEIMFFRTRFTRSKLYQFLKVSLVFILVTFAWLLFKLPEFSHVIAYFKILFNNQRVFFEQLQVLAILFYSVPILIYHLIYQFDGLRNRLKNSFFTPLIYALMLFLILTNSGSSEAFIYFQF